MFNKTTKQLRYIKINRLTELPDISGFAPFKVIIAIEETVSDERQAEISMWLVEMGCRYVMSCGEGCESWPDSVRKANLKKFDLDSLNPRDFVMTLSHSREKLKSVFLFAKKSAKHPEVELSETVVLHLANRDRSNEYLSMYQNV